MARIKAFFCVYFFALLTESLVERALRQARQHHGDETLPLYPEDRACRCPTARRLFDVFEPVQRHVLTRPGSDPVPLTTELSPLQRKLLRLLGVPKAAYQQSLFSRFRYPRKMDRGLAESTRLSAGTDEG